MASDRPRKQTPLRQAAGLAAPLFKRYRLRILGGLAALLLVDLFQLITPRYIKRAVDGLTDGSATSSLLIHTAGMILLLAAGIAFCRFLWRMLILVFSRLLERDLREQFFGHLLTLDRVFFQRHPPGEIMALATNDLAAVQLACGMGVVALVDAVVMTLAALAFMAYIHPRLTLLAILPMPLLIILTRVLSARLHKRFQKVQERFSTLTEFARSTFASIRLFKSFSQEDAQTARFETLGRSYVNDNLKLAAVQGVLFPVSGMVANASLLVVLLFGGSLTIADEITTGDFVAFISYLFMLTWPMMALGWVANLFQRGVTSLKRINEVMTALPLQGESQKTDHSPNRWLAGPITLNNLSFRYPGQQHETLREISVSFQPGRMYGIVGKTGSGKSTLCHLLARLYPVDRSMLSYDGIDAADLGLAEIRGFLSYVPQDVVVFSDTIAANIAFGKPDANQDAVEAAARAAAIHEEILAMPSAYQTRIGEKGVMLSGGQRQRLALARALLLDRPLLLIDDGLSAVDLETEHAIIESMREYLKGRTCIIVSHRLAPLRDADEIIVMDHGRVAARGSHRELLDNSPYYAAIYRFQTSLSGP